jgi:hypothetical protein
MFKEKQTANDFNNIIGKPKIVSNIIFMLNPIIL